MKAPRPLQSPSAQMPGTLVLQAVVDGDVAALVGRDAGRVEAEIVGVRAPADREQHVRADDRRLALVHSTPTPMSVAVRREADALGVEPHRDAFASQDVA